MKIYLNYYKSNLKCKYKNNEKLYIIYIKWF